MEAVERIYSILNKSEIKVGSKVYASDSFEDILDFAVNYNSDSVPDDLMNECGILTAVTLNGTTFPFEVKGVSYHYVFKVEDPKEDVFIPYASSEEMLQDFMKRSGIYKELSSLVYPACYLRSKTSGGISIVNIFCNGNCADNIVCFGSHFDMKEVFENFTYMDGSPCGKRQSE